VAFLNGNKTFGIVKLLVSIGVTSTICFLQMQRNKLCAKGRGRRGEQSVARRWVYMWCQRADVLLGFDFSF